MLITNSLFNKHIGASDSNAGADVQRSLMHGLLELSQERLIVCDFSNSGENLADNLRETEVFTFKTSSLIRRMLPYIFLNLLAKMIKYRPKVVVIYNLYIQQILAIIFYCLLFNKKSVLILQDYRSGELFTTKQRVVDRICLFFVRYINFCVPITCSLSDKVPLPSDSKMVYKGGKTVASESISNKDTDAAIYQAVFSGYLSEYNGLDRIVNFWLNSNTKCKLVIFGDGPLRDFVIKSSAKDSRIKYYGTSTHYVVIDEINRSHFNFCFRYSSKINAKYFYPSKFFIGAKSKSLMLYNRFDELADDFNLDLPCVIEDDLSNLDFILNNTGLASEISKFQQELYENQGDFLSVMQEVFNRIKFSGNVEK